MLTLAEALALISDHLGDSPRARHSIFVGFVMRRLAEQLKADPMLWEITGLCHDLDFEVTQADRSKHGLVAAEWLSGRLPDESLMAIRAHDHRTGVICGKPICVALKLSDALAVICDELGPDAPAILTAPDAVARLESRFTDRPYLVPLLLENARSLSIPVSALADISAAAPPAS